VNDESSGAIYIVLTLLAKGSAVISRDHSIVITEESRQLRCPGVLGFSSYAACLTSKSVEMCVGLAVALFLDRFRQAEPAEF
jgi:hypothetical protein